MWLTSSDSKQDTLHVAKLGDGALSDVLTVGQPGIIHQPALAADGTGALHVVWSQVNEKDLMELRSAILRDGKVQGEITTLASSPNGGNAFAKAAADATGRYGSCGRACAARWRIFSAASMMRRKTRGRRRFRSRRIRAVTGSRVWRLMTKAVAWICYDSSRGNEFNIYATHVDADLKVGETKKLVATSRYEGRVNAVTAQDGKGIWLACERGNEQWAWTCGRMVDRWG